MDNQQRERERKRRQDRFGVSAERLTQHLLQILAKLEFSKYNCHWCIPLKVIFSKVCVDVSAEWLIQYLL